MYTNIHTHMSIYTPKGCMDHNPLTRNVLLTFAKLIRAIRLSSGAHNPQNNLFHGVGMLVHSHYSIYFYDDHNEVIKLVRCG